MQRPRFNGSRHQIHPVRVHHGNQVDHGGFQNQRRVHAEKLSPCLERLGQILGKFQQHRGGDPLVCVVGRGIEHMPVSGPHDQGTNRPPVGGGGEHLTVKKRIRLRQSQNRFVAKRRRHRYIGFHNCQIHRLRVFYDGSDWFVTGKQHQNTN